MVINQGSVETMLVDVTDELGVLTAIPPGATYRVVDTDGLEVITPQPATIDGLRAKCVIDTTSLAKDAYELFLTFSSPPDVPILGPHRFRVV